MLYYLYYLFPGFLSKSEGSWGFEFRGLLVKFGGFGGCCFGVPNVFPGFLEFSKVVVCFFFQRFSRFSADTLDL